jgi:hypothetical protein
MKSYLDGKNKPHDVAKVGVAKNVDHDEFPKEDGAVAMMFSGMPAHPLSHKHRHIL